MIYNNRLQSLRLQKNRAIKKNKVRYELLEEKLKQVDNPKLAPPINARAL
jgi:hypothetical protein